MDNPERRNLAISYPTGWLTRKVSFGARDVSDNPIGLAFASGDDGAQLGSVGWFDYIGWKYVAGSCTWLFHYDPNDPKNDPLGQAGVLENAVFPGRFLRGAGDVDTQLFSRDKFEDLTHDFYWNFAVTSSNLYLLSWLYPFNYRYAFLTLGLNGGKTGIIATGTHETTDPDGTVRASNPDPQSEFNWFFDVTWIT